MPRRPNSVLRKGLYWTLVLAVGANCALGAAAQSRAKRAPNAQGAGTAAQHDPRTDWQRINGAAIELRRQIAERPRDEALRRQLTDLAIDAAFSAERALAIGDASLFRTYRGQFTEQFYDTPERIAHKAGGGSRSAEYAAGVLALHGYAAPISVEAACRHFSAALGKGLPAAKFRTAECLAKTDPARASVLLNEAAASGHPVAAEMTGRACLEAKPQDAQCAWDRLSLAAAAGRPSAQSVLAWMLVQGTGGRSPDPAQAARLYQQAARAGDAPAQNNMGEMYETGHGMQGDPAQAADWYRKAAEAGFAPAQFNLGRLYAAGTGVTKDYTEARRWLEQAERGGVAIARTLLDWMDRNPFKE